MAAWLDGKEGVLGARISGLRSPRPSGRSRRTMLLTPKLSTSVVHTSAAIRGIAQWRPVARPTTTPQTTHSSPRFPSAEYPITTRSSTRWRRPGVTALRAEAGAATARDHAHGVGDVLDAQPDAALVVLDVDRAVALRQGGHDACPIRRARLARDRATAAEPELELDAVVC